MLSFRKLSIKFHSEDDTFLTTSLNISPSRDIDESKTTMPMYVSFGIKL